MGVVQLKGDGGCVWDFEEPFPEWVQNQLERGLLQPVDGQPVEKDEEPDEEDLEAPHHAKKASTLRKEIDAKLAED